MLPQLYVIHDGRCALTQPPEDRCVLSTATTLDEALSAMGRFPFLDVVLFVYDVDLDGRTLLNGRAVP